MHGTKLDSVSWILNGALSEIDSMPTKDLDDKCAGVVGTLPAPTMTRRASKARWITKASTPFFPDGREPTTSLSR
ncbi:MAG: hypothetical protein IPN71_20925 [Fibrobacteres bacterium]|nr:hypothetical protein [Fibrobacterota bacterium]